MQLGGGFSIVTCRGDLDFDPLASLKDGSNLTSLRIRPYNWLNRPSDRSILVTFSWSFRTHNGQRYPQEVPLLQLLASLPYRHVWHVLTIFYENHLRFRTFRFHYLTSDSHVRRRRIRTTVTLKTNRHMQYIALQAMLSVYPPIS